MTVAAGLPVVLRLTGAPVLLLGEVSAARRRQLARAGAVFTDNEAEARFAWITLDHESAEEAALRLKARGVLVNVTDQPDLCDFTMAAIVDRAPLLVAVSTGGASAGLAAAVRQRLELLLPAGLGRLAEALYQRRDALWDRFPDFDERRRAIAALIDGAADPETLDARLAESAPAAPEVVTIRLRSLDPDDLTLREARWLARADRIFHSPEVPSAILDRARPEAVRVVGTAVPPDPGSGLSLVLLSR